MTECPFCNDLLGPADLLPGRGAICPRCGKWIAPGVLARAATASSPPPDAVRPPPPLPKQPARGDAGLAAGKPGAGVDEPEPPDSAIPWLRRLDAGTAAALLVGSLAVVLASVPSLGFLTKPLGGVGILVGLLAGVVPAVLFQKNVWWPLAACALNLASALFVGSGPHPHAPPPPRVAIALREGGMVAPQPAEDSDWVDAGTRAVKWHDIRVQVVAVRAGGVEVEYQGKKSLMAERSLVIRLRVSYEGVEFKQLPYEPWADLPGSPSKNPPTLTDNLNQTYSQKTFGPGRKAAGRSERGYLTPGRMVEEVLVFPAPPAKVEYLRLQLPASAFGEPGEFRFQIPRRMIVNS